MTKLNSPVGAAVRSAVLKGMFWSFHAKFSLYLKCSDIG